MDSHELVEVDEDGEPYEERFVFVDEQSCIGCYNCKNVAPETFFMEDEYGRARVFQQDAADKDVLQEALHTCPVDCIHYVEWDDLVRLEKERRGQVRRGRADERLNWTRMVVRRRERSLEARRAK